MVQKRPFEAEDIYDVTLKHPKQAEPSKQLVSFSESVFPEDASNQIPKTSESGCRQGGVEGDQNLATDTLVELPRVDGGFETSFPGSIPVSSWATSSTSEADVRSEPPVHYSFFPEYFSPDRPIRTLTRYEDIYSFLLEHPPRKLVPVGPDHQVNIPAWNPFGVTRRTDASNAVSYSDFDVGDEVEKRLMGTRVIPMPDMESSTCDDERVGKGRADCSCEDRESLRCVRQHIMERREELMKTIGEEIFSNLGFCEIGEQVAQHWGAEEEQLFHEVVFSNPALLGNNFWNILSVVFPSRSKREIVSYYFNVFMLRKRAEQNRNDLLDIDSDNDEWQGSDDYGDDNEIATQEEDDDSSAESPVYQDDTGPANCYENYQQDYDEHAAEETFDVNGTEDLTNRATGNDPKQDPIEVPHYIGSSFIQPREKAVLHERCDEVIQDESCTSSDAGVAIQKNKATTDNGKSNGCSQRYVLEPCDTKVWDSGFMSCSNNKIDLIPTCNMIEEVFGDGLRQEMRRG